MPIAEVVSNAETLTLTVVGDYAVSVQRRLTHPAVVAISNAARRKLFG